MAVAALIVSVVSAMVSIAAIGVSIWTHWQQGSGIACTWGTARPVFGDEVRDRHIQVTATNHGRSAATVDGWGFVVLDRRGKPTDATIVMMKPPAWLPPCPFRLDGQSSVSWM